MAKAKVATFCGRATLQLANILIRKVAMNTLFKALSHPVRRRIIAMLRTGPLASGDIAAAFDMSWPTITGHLNPQQAVLSAGTHTLQYQLQGMGKPGTYIQFNFQDANGHDVPCGITTPL
jgi:hypothetical protein